MINYLQHLHHLYSQPPPSGRVSTRPANPFRHIHQRAGTSSVLGSLADVRLHRARMWISGCGSALSHALHVYCGKVRGPSGYHIRFTYDILTSRESLQAPGSSQRPKLLANPSRLWFRVTTDRTMVSRIYPGIFLGEDLPDTDPLCAPKM
jgi:hypothetical protein